MAHATLVLHLHCSPSVLLSQVMGICSLLNNDLFTYSDIDEVKTASLFFW